MDKNGRSKQMRKISYVPRKQVRRQEAVEMMGEKASIQQSNEARYNALIENIDSVKPVGDTDCDYTIYLEDYAYTYIYQYASTDLTCEHSAAIVGEYYPESNELIICGIIPIRKDKLAHDEEWINEDALEALEGEKEQYFPGTVVLGWLHMQPGYGTMLTMKEVKAHRDLFNQQGSLLLLVDPINKIETFYIYEGEQLLEQSGYYIYYDKNANMQDYMLDRPLVDDEKDEVDDSVVTQFREIGRRRKKEYHQRNKTNVAMLAGGVLMLALTALVVQSGNQKKEITAYKEQLQKMVQQGTSSNVAETSKDVIVIETPKNGETQEASNDVTGEVGDNVIIDTESPSTQAENVETEAPSVEVTVAPAQEETEDTLVTESNEQETTLEEAPIDEVEKTPEIAVADYKIYTVREGDSLRSISYDHYKTETRTKDIIRLNDIQNGDVIYVGEELKIPVE